MSNAVEHVTYEGRELAVVVRASYRQDGIAFFTPGHYSQQLGYMNRPAGYRIQAHRHKQVDRHVTSTLETLIVRSGLVRVDFYDDDNLPVAHVDVGAGDVILLVTGGHGMTMLEPSEIVEVKQGPYAGDEDKTTFDPPGTNEPTDLAAVAWTVSGEPMGG
jgi:hypothetical protein